MAEDHGPSIKDDERYEALRGEGASKQKAARIANTGRRTAGKRGGKTPPYEELSVDELREQAGKIGVEGRSKMNKEGLIEALRNS